MRLTGFRSGAYAGSMKMLLSLAMLGVCCPLLHAAELTLATIDVQRVLGDYYKAQEVARELKNKEVSFVKELEGLRLEGRRLAGEAEELRRLSLDNARSSREREDNRKNFELKLTDLQSFEVKYQQTREEREAELHAQASRVNRSLHDEILSATRSVGEQSGFNLILNANKANPLSGEVLFAKGVDDITDRVLALLNSTRPASPAPPDNSRR